MFSNEDLKCLDPKYFSIITMDAYDVTIINVLGEQNGVLTNEQNPNSVIPMLRRTQYKALREMGIIKPEAFSTIDNAFSAIDHGVSEVVLINAARFSDLGGGTHIR